MTSNVEPKRVTGKIIKLDSKGWGFINTHAIEFTRIFFHWSALRQDTLNFKLLKVGMQVEFTPIYAEKTEEHEGGWRARQITILDDVDEVNEVTSSDDVP